MVFLNSKKLISLAILSFFVFSFLLTVGLANAEEPLGGLGNTGVGIGYKTGGGEAKTGIARLIGNIIGAVMAFIGVAFMALVIMGALDIIGAGGNDEKVKEGKDKIKNGAIGILVIFAAYLLTVVVFRIAIGSPESPELNIFKINL
ncbi:MAG: hypothetical protein PHR36_00800 [Patescibacteria group bacterium]|nr:hypothetical protein [Patescibacteria group bacterium]